MKNIVKIIQSETTNYSDKLAIIDGKHKVTYAELLTAIDMMSKELKKLSVKTAKRVALLCEDSIDYVILSLAVLKISAVIVPIPFASSKEEIEGVLKEMKIDFEESFKYGFVFFIVTFIPIFTPHFFTISSTKR